MSGGEDPGWVGTVIDVSKWQSSLPDLTGVSGVIARAGIGTKPDALFTTHIANARKAGKWVGSYWYNWGDLSVSDQVNAYIAREKEVGGVQLHTIDWEGTEGFSASQTADFIRLYRARTGEPILLYASESRFRDLGQDANWIANYSQEPAKNYDMWQFGPFRGVDGNHARQRIIDFVKGSKQMAQLPISDMVPRTIVIPVGAKRYDLDGSGPDYTFTASYTRFSPYRVGTLYAYYAVINDKTVIRLVEANGTPIVAETADIWTPDEQAKLDAAVAAAISTSPYTSADIEAAKVAGKAEGTLEERNRIAAAEQLRILTI